MRRAHHFLDITLDSSTLRWWTGDGDITLDSQTYTGLGTRFIPPERVKRSAGLKSQKITLEFDSSRQSDNSDPIGALLDEKWRRRAVRLRRVAWDYGETPDDGDVLIDERGRIQNLSDAIQQDEQPVISMEIESGSLAYLERRPSKRTSVSQKEAFPDDKGFDLAIQHQGTKLIWGKTYADVEIIAPDNGPVSRKWCLGRFVTEGSLAAHFAPPGPYSQHWYLYRIIPIADHRVGSVDFLEVNGERVISSPLVHGQRRLTRIPGDKNESRFWVTFYDGRTSQNVHSFDSASVPSEWTSAHRLRGVACIVVCHRWDDDIAQEFTYRIGGQGAYLYDRRKDSTAGGSGTHRWDNPSTWELSTNAMVAFDHYRMGVIARFGYPAMWFGVGEAAENFPYAEFKELADLCDENVTLKAGGTQKRYEVNGVISSDKSHKENLEALAKQMAAQVIDQGGRLAIRPPVERTPVATITDDDLVRGAPTQADPAGRIDDMVNTLEGNFTDPANDYKPNEYPKVSNATYVDDDNGEISDSHDLPLENSAERAQRLATLEIGKSRRIFELTETYGIGARLIEPGEWFNRESTLRGFSSGKLFIADEVQKNLDGSRTVTSFEVDPNDLVWDENNAATIEAPPAFPQLELPDLDPPTATVEAVEITGENGSKTPKIKVIFDQPLDGNDNLDPDGIVADYYDIEWGVGSDPDGITGEVETRRVDALEVEVLLSDVEPSTSYAVRYRSVRGSRLGEWSNEVTGGDWQYVTTTANDTATEAGSVDWENVQDRPDIDAITQDITDLQNTYGDTAAAAASAAAAAASESAAAQHETNAEAAKDLAEDAQAASEAIQTSVEGILVDTQAAKAGAETAQTLTEAARDAAIGATIDNIPNNFEEDETYWTDDVSGTPSARKASTVESFTFADSSEGRVVVLSSNNAFNRFVTPRATITQRLGRTYRMTVKWLWTGGTAPTQGAVFLTWRNLTGVGGVSTQDAFTPTIPAENTWQTDTHEYTSTGSNPYLIPMFYKSSTFTSTGEIHAVYFEVEDITESKAAEAEALAAATSSSSAESFSDEAEQSASAALGYSTTAQTKAAEASTSASQASQAKSDAESASASAALSEIASAASEAASGQSALAAAASASSADSFANDSEQSAIASESAATLATTKAGEASVSAGQSAQSATDSAGSASSAALSEAASAASELASGQSATAAAGHEAAAESFATQSEAAATASESSKIAAEAAFAGSAGAASQLFPNNFSKDDLFWCSAPNGLPAAREVAALTQWSFRDTTRGRVAWCSANDTGTYKFLLPKGTISLVDGRTYRVSIVWRWLSTGGSYLDNTVEIGWRPLLDTGANGGNPFSGISAADAGADGEWITSTDDYTSTGIRTYLLPMFFKSNVVQANVDIEVLSYDVEDVTDSVASQASAVASASSATQASASETASGQSASAANTAKIEAETAAGQASTSQSQAASSETNAAGSESAAALSAAASAESATDSQNFSLAAAGHASTASTKATEAGQAAAAANTSKVSAEAAYQGTLAAVAEAFPSTFNQDGAYWVTQNDGTPAQRETYDLQTLWNFKDVTEGRVAYSDGNISGYHWLSPRGLRPDTAGRVYRMTVSWRWIGGADALADDAVVAIFKILNADGTTHTQSNDFLDAPADGEFVTYTREWTATGAGAYISSSFARRPTFDGDYEFQVLTYEFEDVTESKAAAASAQTAESEATAAGQSAIAADTSETNANTAAADASTSAGQASVSETNADGSAVAAAASESAADASAQGAAGSASASATSASESAASADDSNTYAQASLAAKTAAESAQSAASTSASQASVSAGQASAAQVQAAAEASAAGNSADAAEGFSVSASNSATAAQDYYNLTVSEGGTIQAEVTSLSQAVTSAEGDIASIDTRLTTAEADVVTNAGAITDIEGGTAWLEQVVSASGGDLAAYRMRAGQGGSFIELVSTVLRLANITNGNVIEVMRAINGYAYFAQPISSDFDGKRLTIGPGFGLASSKCILWFGPNTTAVFNMSRTNGYFALGSDGEPYFGSATLGSQLGGNDPLTGVILSAFYIIEAQQVYGTGTKSVTSTTITMTPQGGSGNYTYSVEITASPNTDSGTSATITNLTDSGSTGTFQIQASGNIPAADTSFTFRGFARITVTDDDSGRKADSVCPVEISGLNISGS